jgi:hypothetical protein
MASIIDPTIEETGNPAEALKAVQEAAAERGTGATSQETKTITDPRFANKTAADMVEIYKNLEREYGRKANESGQLRQMQDQLLALKRENDLRANGATQQAAQQPEVSASDLLENPKQALDRYFEQKESASTRELRQRLAFQEQQMAQTSFVSKHPDWQTHTNDPDFVEWTKQTPWRTNLAQQAAQENLGAADALLTEYKQYKPLLNKQTTKTSVLDSARSVGLERASTSGDETRTVGKVIRRADMMALRISDPDKYESPAVQNELLRAIAENRYK